MNYLDRFNANEILFDKVSKTGVLFEEADKTKEAPKENQGETPDVKENEGENNNSKEPKTAIDFFSNNADLISEILWRFLTESRRKEIDSYFYEALKKNNVFISDLNAKDEDFAKALEDSKINKKESLKQKKQEAKDQSNKAQEPEEKEKENLSNTSTSTADQKFVYKQSFDPELFAELLNENVLKTIGQAISGMRPTKVKASQINAKSIYNNCVLILVIEIYLTTVMNTFKRIKNITVNDIDDELSESGGLSNERFSLKQIVDIFPDLTITELKDYIRNKKTIYRLSRLPDLEQEEQSEFSKLKRKTNKTEEKFPDLKEELLKYKNLISVSELTKLEESVEFNGELIIEGVLETLSTFFKSKFKVIDLGKVTVAQFKQYCNYLFLNKQFFIQQAQMLNKYMGANRIYGIRFYKALEEFNSLPLSTRKALNSELFNEASSSFDNNFNSLKPLIKTIAYNIAIDTAKEIDSQMSGAFKAGVRVGDWIARKKSGQMQTRPIGQVPNNKNNQDT